MEEWLVFVLWLIVPVVIALFIGFLSKESAPKEITTPNLGMWMYLNMQPKPKNPLEKKTKQQLIDIAKKEYGVDLNLSLKKSVLVNKVDLLIFFKVSYAAQKKIPGFFEGRARAEAIENKLAEIGKAGTKDLLKNKLLPVEMFDKLNIFKTPKLNNMKGDWFYFDENKNVVCKYCGISLSSFEDENQLSSMSFCPVCKSGFRYDKYLKSKP